MQEIDAALDLNDEIEISGEGQLPSRYRVTELAVSVIGAVGSAIASLSESCGYSKERLQVVVDRRLASLWFAQSIHPIDWEMPPAWDAIAGDYQTRDGWIKLHTNLRHHRRAACMVLGVEPERSQVEKAVSAWSKDELETAIVSAGGVAAAMRRRDEWQVHSQGSAVAQEPLIQRVDERETPSPRWAGTAQRPLKGLRVLDLTRVLAGPVATRTLAGFGAEILRIDPPSWEEAIVVPDITLGKNCARLDLREATACSIFKSLLCEADILVHGYRPGALDGLGFGEGWRRDTAPNLLEVSLDAYGWSGPWAGRRGFDSLVQMSSGIADAGMQWADADKPMPLPVQALDHATGYLMAAAIIRTLDKLVRGERVCNARLSLARTAELLAGYEQHETREAIGDVRQTDFAEEIEHTPWGKAHRLKPPVNIGGVAMEWRTPACKLGSSPAAWE